MFTKFIVLNWIIKNKTYFLDYGMSVENVLRRGSGLSFIFCCRVLILWMNEKNILNIWSFLLDYLFPSNFWTSDNADATANRSLWNCWSGKFNVFFSSMCSTTVGCCPLKFKFLLHFTVGFLNFLLNHLSTNEIFIRYSRLFIGLVSFISWKCSNRLCWFEMRTFDKSSTQSSWNFKSFRTSLTCWSSPVFLVFKKVSRRIMTIVQYKS